MGASVSSLNVDDDLKDDFNKEVKGILFDKADLFENLESMESIVHALEELKTNDDQLKIALKIEDEIEEIFEKYKIQIIETSIKLIPESIEKAAYVFEKFPFIYDVSFQVLRYLQYQRTQFYNIKQYDVQKLLNYIKTGIENGTTVVIILDINTLAQQLEILEKDLCKTIEIDFNISQLTKRYLFSDSVLTKLFSGSIKFLPKDEFCIIYVVENDKQINLKEVKQSCIKLSSCLIICDSESESNANTNISALEEAIGVKDIRRNSLKLVEAAFENEIEIVKSEIEKGYFYDSVDRHDHTALSESCLQDNREIIKYLLTLGANPNSQSDIGKTPLFRACFNGHHNLVQLLLEIGADPRISSGIDKPIDVAKNEETKKVLDEWAIEKTDELIRIWKEEEEKSLEDRLKTAAERESYAKIKLQSEILELLNTKTVKEIKTRLEELIEEAFLNKEKLRVKIDLRDDMGNTILLNSVVKGDFDKVEFLLNHYLQFDEIFEKLERDMFYVNIQARNNKGWNCVALAILHNRPRILNILLKFGCNPYLRNNLGKNGFDLVQDSKDAALNIIIDRSELRNILYSWKQIKNQLLESKEILI